MSEDRACDELLLSLSPVSRNLLTLARGDSDEEVSDNSEEVDGER